MLFGRTIFARNQLSAPQEKVHVQLAAHPFLRAAPFSPKSKKMCGSKFAKGGQKKGSVFAVGVLSGEGVFAAGEKKKG